MQTFDDRKKQQSTGPTTTPSSPPGEPPPPGDRPPPGNPYEGAVMPPAPSYEQVQKEYGQHTMAQPQPSPLATEINREQGGPAAPIPTPTMSHEQKK